MNREAAMREMVEKIAPFTSTGVTKEDRNLLHELRLIADKAGPVDGLPVSFEEAKSGNSLQARFGEAISTLDRIERELWKLFNPQLDLPTQAKLFTPIGPEPIKEKI